jgi:hypothetical protein
MSDELVTVLETGDAVMIALAKAALDGEDIRYVVEGDAVQDFIGLGRFPGGFNAVTGPARFQVSAADAERARAALQDLGAT